MAGIIFMCPETIEKLLSLLMVPPLNACTYLGLDDGATDPRGRAARLNREAARLFETYIDPSGPRAMCVTQKLVAGCKAQLVAGTPGTRRGAPSGSSGAGRTAACSASTTWPAATSAASRVLDAISEMDRRRHERIGPPRISVSSMCRRYGRARDDRDSLTHLRHTERLWRNVATRS